MEIRFSCANISSVHIWYIQSIPTYVHAYHGMARPGAKVDDLSGAKGFHHHPWVPLFSDWADWFGSYQQKTSGLPVKHGPSNWSLPRSVGVANCRNRSKKDKEQKSLIIFRQAKVSATICQAELVVWRYLPPMKGSAPRPADQGSCRKYPFGSVGTLNLTNSSGGKSIWWTKVLVFYALHWLFSPTAEIYDLNLSYAT